MMGPMDVSTFLAGLLVGLFSGITSGLLGVSPGGGLVVFATLLLGVDQHVAQGMPLAAAQIPPTSIKRYWKDGRRCPLIRILLLTVGFLVGHSEHYSRHVPLLAAWLADNVAGRRRRDCRSRHWDGPRGAHCHQDEPGCVAPLVGGDHPSHDCLHDMEGSAMSSFPVADSNSWVGRIFPSGIAVRNLSKAGATRAGTTTVISVPMQPWPTSPSNRFSRCGRSGKPGMSRELRLISR